LGELILVLGFEEENMENWRIKNSGWWKEE